MNAHTYASTHDKKRGTKLIVGITRRCTDCGFPTTHTFISKPYPTTAAIHPPAASR